jgi:hypothetical protein
MKVAGFTIIKNAIKYDFPVVEAIRSILPICDEFVVAVGASEDDTLALIRSIDSPKIRIIETVWNVHPDTKGGTVLAEETNKALAAVSPDVDWCFYIQSDEVLHEKYLDAVKNTMLQYLDNQAIDGLLFHYKHFFGSYQFVGASLRWYRKEVRIVRNKKSIYSYKDAQSFRQNDNQKLRVKQIDATIYHYGYVREPAAFAKKLNFQSQLSHGQAAVIRDTPFDFEKEADAVFPFLDTHPTVMTERIKNKNWDFQFDPTTQNRFHLKDRFKMFVERYTGYRIGEFKNYVEV